MPVKQYGIYLCYAPTVDLRREGLGRYLAAFLNGAAARDDVQFVLVCPSWSRDSLYQLFASEGVPSQRFRLVSPAGPPWILRVYQVYLARKKRKKGGGWRQRSRQALLALRQAYVGRLSARLAAAHDVSGLVVLLFEAGLLLLLLLLVSPLLLFGALLLLSMMLARRYAARLAAPLRRSRKRASRLLSVPKDDGFVLRLYQAMEQAEAGRMQALIEHMPDVRAWYCPTAFWPSFNRIRAPRLMCVPDVVLADFPVGFSNIGGNRFLANFESVESAIRSSEHFVTYSEAVKWETLVDRYGVRAANVTVVEHAPNMLQHWVGVQGSADAEASSRQYCRTLLLQALHKSRSTYISGIANGELQYLFYASQFRPNKNVLSLLRAYEYLLRKRLLKHKLILTGDPGGLPEIGDFIKQHHLENEVLCLHGLSIQQLAACYKLADLAVNPSLSEGGCPFTFSEALSVDTPVVMARIAVTEEVLTDARLQDVTFFDPYDWQDMAQRIEWALNNRESLLQIQRITYQQLVQRNWRDVVNEHLAVLERIATPIEAVQ